MPIFHPEDAGSMDLRNVGILPQAYTALQLRRPWLESLLPWMLQISNDGTWYTVVKQATN